MIFADQLELKSRILVVDDTPSNLRLLVKMLTSKGYVVHPADGAIPAFRFLESALPDLILLDIVMPDMDGYEICARLKAEERTRDIPIIFISAADQVFDKVRGFGCGAVDYIVKPFEPQEVLARIETHLALRSLRERLEQRVAERTAELRSTNEHLRQEIVERAQAEAALRRSQQDYESLVNSIDGIVWEYDVASERFLFVSQQAERLLGYPVQEWFAAPNAWRKYLHAEDYDRVIDERVAETRAKRDHDVEYRMIAADGREVWLRDLVKVIVENDEPAKLRGIMVDITAHRLADERIRHMAHHDALTGLPNRTLLVDRINQAIAQAQRDNRQYVGVLFLDLDYFKHINDSLGHPIGDRLLKVAAQRLTQCLRRGDSVARLGGDEFVLSLPAVADSNDAAHVAQKALDSLDRTFLISGHQLHVSGSIGISLYPTDGKDAEALLRAADTAMYHAKEKGRHNFQFFTPALNAAAQQRLTLEIQLRQALARQEFALYYQPQVDLESGRIVSAEALLRWQSDGNGAVPCGEFIAAAEQSGLILPLGEWALRQACRQLRQWRRSGFPDLRIAVNLSAQQFFQPRFQDVVKRILAENDIPPAALDLEITESILMQPSEDNLTTLKEISAMGTQLAIDDFGVGYSSLAYLQRFPISTLKIDRSFVSGIGRNPANMALITAIIAMAYGLKLKVIAEGVETAEEAAMLKAQGCHGAQGYYYSQAVPVATFTNLLHKGVLSVAGM